ncbi:MAG: 50S ribosomal protein L3 [Parcubacteria group bacterium RIFCSPHIGHO2_01_FULL_47_10b]|nr:ribosomal protein L3 [uncultured bacterium]OHB20406.1 MAG: 50S ribosomal protein L3 [Parcubacteria group bacterium RIFCSPHIGHO2_01_FULL_47_10b]
MKFLLGTKIGMTQIFSPKEEVIPVTLIQAGPVQVTQVRTTEKDGYQAIQVGFQETKKTIHKAKQGHLKDLKPYAKLREFRVPVNATAPAVKRGDMLDVSVFTVGDYIEVIGISKGKGFQGPVKRHGFAGGPRSHGHRYALRQLGSTGHRFPQHTQKGKRMAGRMGSDQVTIKNLEVVLVEPTQHVIGVRGAVPGPIGAMIKLVQS